MKGILSTVLLLSLPGFLRAANISVSLGATMNGNSYFSEDLITVGYSRINLGNGSLGSANALTGDRDGHYLLPGGGHTPATDPNPQPVGSGWDMFPRETQFSIGSLIFDNAGFTGIGTEVFSITSLDLSAFWKADPNRTNTSQGPPTVVSDISDYAIGLWFFNGPGQITFGALDASDTVTFTDGVLTSINLQITTAFSVQGFGTPAVWDGTFSVTGANLSYQINDSAATFMGNSTFVADLTGTVNSVIPEPSALALLGLAGLITANRRFRWRS